MQSVFVSIFEVHEGIRGILMNESIAVHPTTVYKFDGIEFKFIYCDDRFFQLSVYAYNKYSTQLLGATVENCGQRIGGEYDIPFLIKTDGGFAGILCAYLIILEES